MQLALYGPPAIPDSLTGPLLAVATALYEARLLAALADESAEGER